MHRAEAVKTISRREASGGCWSGHNGNLKEERGNRVQSMKMLDFRSDGQSLENQIFE